MPWTDRQTELLRAMGLRVWVPPTETADAEDRGQTGLVAAAAQAGETAAPQVQVVRPGPEQVARPVSVPPAAAPQPLAPPVHRAPPALRAGPTLPAAVASLDWAGLQNTVAACQACSLCETRQHTVFGSGHLQADWLIVGEAPGEQEDQQGEPFVGASGQLLDAMLQALQLSRAPDGPSAQRVYIANTLKCRPPRNRNPQPEEMLKCEPFLQRQIELLQPRIILAMGRFAVQALLRSSEPLGKLRGRVHQYAGVPLVVSYHPSYLLRSLPEKAKAWEDLCLAADTLAQQPPRAAA
jgi:DNA polymerase